MQDVRRPRGLSHGVGVRRASLRALTQCWCLCSLQQQRLGAASGAGCADARAGACTACSGGVGVRRAGLGALTQCWCLHSLQQQRLGAASGAGCADARAGACTACSSSGWALQHSAAWAPRRARQQAAPAAPSKRTSQFCQAWLGPWKAGWSLGSARRCKPVCWAAVAGCHTSRPPSAPARPASPPPDLGSRS